MTQYDTADELKAYENLSSDDLARELTGNSLAELGDILLEELAKRFRPEFLNNRAIILGIHGPFYGGDLYQFQVSCNMPNPHWGKDCKFNRDENPAVAIKVKWHFAPIPMHSRMIRMAEGFGDLLIRIESATPADLFTPEAA